MAPGAGPTAEHLGTRGDDGELGCNSGDGEEKGSGTDPALCPPQTARPPKPMSATDGRNVDSFCCIPYRRNIADPLNFIGVRCNSICHSSARHNKMPICINKVADLGVHPIRYPPNNGSSSEDKASLKVIGHGRRADCDGRGGVDCDGSETTKGIGGRRLSASGTFFCAWFDDSSSQPTMNDRELLDVSVRFGGRVRPCVRFAEGDSEVFEVTPHSEVYGVHPRFCLYVCRGRDHTVVKVVRRGPEKENAGEAQWPSRGDRAASKGEQKRTSFISNSNRNLYASATTWAQAPFGPSRCGRRCSER